MARPELHRRSFGVVLLLQLTGLLCPRSDIGVQSFVLRSRSLDDLATALADTIDDNEDSESDDVTEDRDDAVGYEFLDPASTWSNRWNSNDELERPMIGVYDGFEPETDEETGGAEQDAEDLTLAEKVIEAIGSKQDNDVNFDDAIGGYSQGEPTEIIMASGTDEKTPLNKSELKELFDIVTPETVTGPLPVLTVSKKSELTKNEVENLFENVAEVTPSKNKEELEKTVAAVIVNGVENASASKTGSSSEVVATVVPTVKVTTIEELVKTVAKDKTGDTGNGSEEKDTTLDVKEETLFPNDHEKLTKEWLIQLAQPEDDKQDGDSGEEPDTAEDVWRSRGGKSKRSIPVPYPVANFDETDISPDGKSRAVELLKAYIRLQEEENHHLTEALDMATLGQAERTDRYLDGQISHLREAVSDEQSIEAIRALIRDEEEGPEEDDDAADDDDDGDLMLEDDGTIGGVPLMAAKRSHPDFEDGNLLTFDANDADDDDGANDVIFYEDGEEARLRERLREYALQKELDEIRQATDAVVAAETDNDDIRAPPEVTYLPAVNYRSPVGENRRFNPFLRDIEQGINYRPSFVATKRFEPIKIRKYAADDDEDDDDERRREELDEVEAAVKAALEEEQRRAFVEKLQEALPVPLSVEAVDDEDDDDGQERPLFSGVCPAIEELTDNCLVARERGLTLDEEALQLCNRHQLCYSCGDQYGLMPDACDRAYLSEADRLCSDPMSADTSSSRCRREAASLYVMMLDGHRAHSGSGFVVPEACRQRCTFDVIVGPAAAVRLR